MNNLPDAFKSFLFAPVNLRTVRTFSILTACLLVIDFYPVEPFDPVKNIIALMPWQQLAVTTAYRGISFLLIIGFACGFRPRITGLFLCALLFPLIFMSYTPASRQILLFVLFCLALLNAGRSTKPLPIWPIRLIQLQLCIVYGINALAKFSPEYLSGDILVAMSMTLPNFLTDMSDGFYHAVGLAIPVAVAAKASALIELVLALGFWHPTLCWLTAGLGIIFHLQLKTIVRIGMLDWTCMFLYLSFLLPFVDLRKRNR